MYLFKKMITVCCLLLTIVCTGTTQTLAQQKSSEAQAKMITDRQKSQLSLTGGQYDKVYNANLEFVTALSQAKENSGSNKMAMLQQFRTLDDAHDREMKNILSADQFALFQKKKKENRKEMKAAFDTR